MRITNTLPLCRRRRSGGRHGGRHDYLLELNLRGVHLVRYPDNPAAIVFVVSIWLIATNKSSSTSMEESRWIDLCLNGRSCLISSPLQCSR
uniref:Uncharacterized protein n=1 Tax=Oryza sativa subsp. japonica TaxID=39947 RepID=Q6EPS3_ORYSJ|nr:hypothetical protein [Oryza sativa Japonica Group]